MQNNNQLHSSSPANSSAVAYLKDAELLSELFAHLGPLKNTSEHIAQYIRRVATSGISVPPTEISIPGLSSLSTETVALITTLAELIRRFSPRAAPHISGPADVYSLVRHLSLSKQEHFVTVSLNGAHDVIAVRTITTGLVNQTSSHPREVFSDLITDRACAVIVAHNHPSNNLRPSSSDLTLTKRLSQAGELLGIPLLDHLIFGTQTYLSLKEQHGEYFS